MEIGLLSFDLTDWSKARPNKNETQ